ncbi:MAG: glycosyltransferase [Planctomycetes bacterium]|nr:glycosyltransferase [Planctomycetota bacterium]
MNIVTITKSWPSPGFPAEGCFIESRMRAVARHHAVCVLHAVPFLRKLPADAPAGRPAVHRVRYFYCPGLLKSLDGRFLAASLRAAFARRVREDGVDLVDAHFGYPEGAAAVRLGREIGRPVVLTLRGTEAAFAGRGRRGRQMAAAIRAADRVIAVSRPLRDLAIDAGAEPGRIAVICNGADTERFRPGGREEARRRLGLAPHAPVLLSVGALIERKGHRHLVGTLPRLRRTRPGTILVIAGSGPLAGRLRREAARAGVSEAVRFAGLLTRDELPEYYRAADVLALASSWEGFANVFFEAFASGLPVVATDVGGAREAMPDENLGRLVPYDHWDRFAEALEEVLGGRRDPVAIRAFAERNGWDRVGARVDAVFREVVGAGRRR